MLAKMKVLQVIPTLHAGGAEKLLHDIVVRQKEKGVEVDVCVFNSEETALTEMLRESGVKVIGYGKGTHVYSPLNFFRLLKQVRRYEVIHAHCLPAQLFCALCSIFSRGYYVTTEHNTDNWLRKVWFVKWIERLKYRCFSKVICISEATRKSLSSYLICPEEEFDVIENGIDIARYHDAKPFEGMKSKGDVAITMVAGFRHQKDQDTLVRAIKLLNDDRYHLYLVGDGKRRTEVVELVSLLQLTDKVHFMGWRQDVPSILKESDIVVMSSWWEGFGLAAVEGMAAEKPVVASNVPGLAEVVGGGGILFTHGNEEELAQHIQRLANDKELYATTSRKCYEKSLWYDISKTVDQYLAVYSAAINKD